MKKKTINPYSREELKFLLKNFDLKAKKGLGQNFLLSEEIARSIIEFAGIDKTDTVFEIGPGFLSLSLPLALKAKKVLGFEMDSRLAGILGDNFELPANFSIFIGDFLDADIAQFIEPSEKSRKVVSNLPYSAASQILIKILKASAFFDSATLTFQKEMAERIKSSAGKKSYGTLSILTQLIAEVDEGPLITPSSFFPAPEVTSGVLKLRFRKNPLIDENNFSGFSLFLKSIFQFRRKKLLNTLKNALCLTSQDLKYFLEKENFDPDTRIEQLDPAEIFRMYTKSVEMLPLPGKFKS